MAQPTIRENYIVNKSYEYESDIIYNDSEPSGSAQAAAGVWVELHTTGKVRLLRANGSPKGVIVSVGPTRATICIVGTNLVGHRGGDTTTASTINLSQALLGAQGTLAGGTAKNGYLKAAEIADSAAGRGLITKMRGSVESVEGTDVGDEVRVNLP